LRPLYFSLFKKSPPLQLIILQIIFAIVVLVIGANLFVDEVSIIAEMLGITPFILSLIIAPIATELPEKFNSVIWLLQKKDTFALGNITGAMVFQSVVLPVSAEMSAVLSPRGWQNSYIPNIKIKNLGCEGMDLNVFNVLDELEDMIQNSKRVLGKVLVEEESLLEYLDKLRTLLPEEIHQAKWLSKERERLIQEAHQESERILTNVQEEARRKADESEVVRQAKESAEEIIAQSKRLAKEIKSGAAQYADDILLKLEDNISQSLTIINQARNELNEMK
jgi:vacuolar-type H+-ATPase subunit H